MNHAKELIGILKTERDEKLPRVTLYLPTHRREPDNKKDPIVFKNLMKKAEELMAKNYEKGAYQEVLKRLEALQKDTLFWNHSTEGLGVLAVGTECYPYRLLTPVPEDVVVGETFHILPLLEHGEAGAEMLLVDLAKDRFRLFSVGPYHVRELEQDEIKTHFNELFEDLDSESNVNTGSYAGTSGAFHGHRAKPEEVRKDREKYFRYLDASLSRFNKDRLPVILAGTTENVAAFREWAKGDFYAKEALTQPLESVTEDQVQQLVQKRLQEEKGELKRRREARLVAAKQEHAISLDLRDIQQKAQEGRVAELFVNTRRMDPNRRMLDAAVAQLILTGIPVHAVDYEDGILDTPTFAVLR
ncbi:hypothetical protein ABB02_01037 [Clostridiaceae bacterium JG1575]|nr:hypothetical protein ABB02_01037 [Clostridiaceae bacterium JG1575]